MDGAEEVKEEKKRMQHVGKGTKVMALIIDLILLEFGESGGDEILPRKGPVIRAMSKRLQED